MIINVVFNALVIGGKETKYKKKDGTDGTFYRLVLEKDGEACNMNCNEESFSKLQRLEEAELIAQFNTDYNTMRVVGVNYGL